MEHIAQGKRSDTLGVPHSKVSAPCKGKSFNPLCCYPCLIADLAILKRNIVCIFCSIPAPCLKAFALSRRDCSNTRYPGCRFACPGLWAPLGFQPALAKSETLVIRLLSPLQNYRKYHIRGMPRPIFFTKPDPTPLSLPCRRLTRAHASGILSAKCLHSALFVCTALIIKRFKSVDKPVFYLHSYLHAVTITSPSVCTCLHPTHSAMCRL